MISKEYIEKIAIDYLTHHLNYKIIVHEEPFGYIYYTYDHPIEDVYFVECVRESSYSRSERDILLISKTDGKVIGFKQNIVLE